MRKIKPESIKVGDWLQLFNKKFNGNRINSFSYIVKIIDAYIMPETKTILWWLLRDEYSEVTDFELSASKGRTNYSNENFNRFIVYKLNKKDIEKVKRQILLEKLR